MADDPGRTGDGGEQQELVMRLPTLLARFYYAARISTAQSLFAPKYWYKGWQDYFHPPAERPDLIKRYDCRPHLSVRVFFPASYDQTSPNSLPTLFTIHGGGFCLGAADDDDPWNRSFADMHRMLVIELDYSKAPWAPFPTALHDVEALFLAVAEDASIPIDYSRVALVGFSAGGNLALGLSQLPSVKGHATAAPKAVVPMYAPLDFTSPPISKADRRPYKEGLLSGIRGQRRDYIMEFADVFDWAYIPYGQQLRDPLLCPAFAERANFPPHVLVVAAELDYLAFENWRFACRLAGREVSAARAGREEAAKTQELELRDERFHWEYKERGVRWLLVPDVIHAFDLHPAGRMASDPVTRRDGEAKAAKVMSVLAEWLLETAWR